MQSAATSRSAFFKNGADGGTSRIWIGQWLNAEPDGGRKAAHRFIGGLTGGGGGENLHVAAGAAAAENVRGRRFGFLGLFLGRQQRFHRFLVKVVRFPLDDLEGAGGAVAQTGAQAVAVFFGDHFGLAVLDDQCALGAVGDAFAAAGA